MTLYLALLRGINVGGRNRVPMKELAGAMESDGFDNVTTYIQSGNLLFESNETDTNRLGNRLRELIEEHFDTTTPVVMRTPNQLYRAISRNPFLDDEDDFKKLHLMFLDREPDRSDVEDLDPDRSPGDRFAVDGRDIYLHYPNGSGRSKLTIDHFERRLGVTATGRNWNTVLKLRELMADRQ